MHLPKKHGMRFLDTASRQNHKTTGRDPSDVRPTDEATETALVHSSPKAQDQATPGDFCSPTCTDELMHTKCEPG